MICEKCGMNLDDNMQFCHNCGNPIKKQKTNDNNLQIIGRSKSFKSELEDWRRITYRAVISEPLVLCITVAIMYFVCVLVEDFKEIEWLQNVCLIICFASAPWFYKKGNDFNNSIKTNFEDCEAEELILDNCKIFGKTKHNDFKLDYKEISNVRIEPKSIQPKKIQRTFDYKTLIIEEISGDKLEFNSFSNANELYSIINSRIN